MVERRAASGSCGRARPSRTLRRAGAAAVTLPEDPPLVLTTVRPATLVRLTPPSQWPRPQRRQNQACLRSMVTRSRPSARHPEGGGWGCEPRCPSGGRELRRLLPSQCKGCGCAQGGPLAPPHSTTGTLCTQGRVRPRARSAPRYTPSGAHEQVPTGCRPGASRNTLRGAHEQTAGGTYPRTPQHAAAANVRTSRCGRTGRRGRLGVPLHPAG
jgi:hypothetical protein